MEFKARLSNYRMAPRKARKVADLVRGKKAEEAVAILSFTINKTARPVLKLLNSAIDAAKKNFKIEASNLFISKITVDEGPKMKRWHAMSRGRAYPIEKRTSHVALVLSEITPAAAKAVKKEKPKAENLKTEKKTTKPKVKKPKK